jgi:pimeloyl-ACP methyl ester carboxylesterase
LNQQQPLAGYRHHLESGLDAMPRIFLVLAFGVLLLVTSGFMTHAARVPHFEPTTCADLPDIGDVLPRLQCGVVRVPRDYANLEGPTYALAVVVIASAQQPAQPDPVVYISGGPGAPLTIYSGFQARHPYAADRDLILVDQRGMGRSEPRLCPELQGDLVRAMLAVVTEPTVAALAADRAAHAACRDAIRSRGIEPDTFGTATTVEDYEWVRRALGVTSWNVIGESYGTTVAMTLLARHSQSIRSAVLDSLNPPDATFAMPWSVRVARARDTFFAACRANPACAYPDLARLYRETLVRLERDAPLVSLPPALHVPGDHVRLTPSLFEAVVGRLVYYPTYYAGLPDLIAATRGGDLKAVAIALGALLGGAMHTGNEGAFVAVECRDRPQWREPATSPASALDLALLPPGICQAWSALGSTPEVPHDSTVPTLVLAGQFDPNIGPAQSQSVADQIGRQARWIEFAGIGHSVRHFSPCAQRLVATFIAKPESDQDTACANDNGEAAAVGPPRP